MGGMDSELRERLQRTTTIGEAAQLVCDALVDRGFPLVSVYLTRSDRLRCFGVSGYSQVLDGFPPVAGVISATVRTGAQHVVEVAASDIYLKAAPEVVAEVCVPVVLDGAVIGALNIESRTPLPSDTATIATDHADLFATRVRDLGGVPAPSGWMLLADQAARLVQIGESDRLLAEALDVASQLSGFDSGLVAVGTVASGYSAAAARGELAAELASLPGDTLAGIGRWVDGPMACYTLGQPDGETLIGFEALERAGMRTLVVVALARGDQQMGFLAVADRLESAPSAELVEQLELLASLVSSALTNARHLAALRDLARQDPLTGLGHNAAFAERLQSIRRTGSMYAVLVIDIDHFKAVNDTYGHAYGDGVLRDLADALRTVVRVDDAVFRTGGDEFAAVVPVANDAEAMSIARRLEEAARSVGTPVSIGVALDDNGGRDDLYAEADAALYRAKRAGRNVTMFARGDGRSA
jgi:diguanylate cyclase (GGDEF)-like protein